MVLQHTAYYFLARGLPGIINFLALSVYTRLLMPDEYGRYALALATVSFASAVLFQWIQMGLLRFLPRHAGHEERLLSTILAAYLLMVAVTGVGGGAVYLMLESGPWRMLLPVALILLWVQAWFEINLQLLVSRLKPLRYGTLSGARALLALAVGGGLAWAGWQAQAPLWGLVVGGFVAILCVARGVWVGISFKNADRALLKDLAKYGLPLGATFVFSFVISTSDRYLIAWLIDEKSVGLYAAGYDLAQFSLGVLMMIVNLAAYPLIVRALELEGFNAARNQLKQQGLLLLAIAAPATAGFIVLANNISAVLLGTEFRVSAAGILPWIACAALVGGIKAYYFDLAFQLGKYTLGQVHVVVLASLVNVGLNLVWIPRFGLLGAAWATLAAYSAGLLLSAWLGRKHFNLPGIPKQSSKVLAAVAFMVAVIWSFREQQGAMALFGQILLGCGCYMTALWFLNPGDLRATVMRRMARMWP
jgi:O-antigen/teichoic acid export membrane protein